MKPQRFFALAVLSISLSGCGPRIGHVTNLPPGVTEAQAKSYDAEVANLHKIADVTTTLRKTVIGLRNDGAFQNNTAYAVALQTIGRIDELQLSATRYLRDAPEYFGEPQKQQIKDIFTGIAREIQSLNEAGVTGIKNPDSLKQINTLLAELTGVVNLVLSLTQ